MKNVHIIGETFYVLFGILLKRVLGNYCHLHSSPSWIESRPEEIENAYSFLWENFLKNCYVETR
jgi:hypothetical protein